MPGLNDLHYALGTSTLAVSGTGGTLLVPEARNVIRRWVYADGGTCWIVGASQAIGASNAIALTSLTDPFKIEGPAAFVLLATTNGATAKVVSWFSQSGVPDASKAT
jgi:hypothetical protein